MYKNSRNRYAKVLGNGLAVIDFGARVGNIETIYQAGATGRERLIAGDGVLFDPSSYSICPGSHSLPVTFFVLPSPRPAR